jgi:hypothetical protein
VMQRNKWHEDIGQKGTQCIKRTERQKERKKSMKTIPLDAWMLLSVVWFCKYRILWRPNHSFRGVLQSVWSHAKLNLYTYNRLGTRAEVR